MTKIQNNPIQKEHSENTTNQSTQRVYDLEDRTFKFAKKVAGYVNDLPKTVSNTEFSHQLIKAAGSVGANYIEANESLSKRDFIVRVKISRKESKESSFWLRLTEPKEERKQDRESLTQEAVELMKIFGSILAKTENKVLDI